MRTEKMVTKFGNDSKYQVIVYGDVKKVFVSYGKKIAEVSYLSGKVTLDSKYWDYSATTGYYRNQFLGETKKETQAKIGSGEYKLKYLN